MAELFILVGLPASGKTSWVKSNIGENDVHVSSDEIREELFGDSGNQDHNSKVFEVMRTRASEALKDGKKVFYDATNISRKRRRGLMNSMPKGTKFISVYFDTSPDTILTNNANRGRYVPEDAIIRMYKRMQIPVRGEGFDVVYRITGTEPKAVTEEGSSAISCIISGELNHCELFSMMDKYHLAFEDSYDLPQDSFYHSFSVSRHIYHVYQSMLQNEKFGKDIDMLMASLCHDLGKAYTKSFVNYRGEDKRYASFIGHENVSSQIVYEIYKKLPFFNADLVSTLCQFHMRLYDNSDKNIDKLKKLVGDGIYERLVVLNDCDVAGK